LKTKQEIITSMCYTWRHDYGLSKHPDDKFGGLITAGMTDLERQSLYKQMEQLYTHHIEPIVTELEAINSGTIVSAPRNREQAVVMLNLAQMYLDSNS
jgi:hypothetical protein